MNATCDTIIVGAGFAGLSAALTLRDAGQSVRVVEARDRVGGRVHTHPIDAETYVDLGAQWIGPTQDRMYEIVDRYKIQTFETYNQGINKLLIDGVVRDYKGLIPKLDPLSLLNLDRVMKRLDRLATSVNLDHLPSTPASARLDSQTLAAFLDRHLRMRSARKVIDAGLETVFGATAAEISLLFALFYIKSGTDLTTLLEIKDGAQQHRLIGGVQQVLDRMADDLRDGDDHSISLESPVESIEQSADRVIVRGADFSLQAHNVIVTIPPTLAGRIRYAPDLPALRDQLTQRMPMGTVVKCYAIYQTPFWRDTGLSGQAVCDESSILQTVFDNSPADGSKGMLMGFSLANRARKLLSLSESERRHLVVQEFVRLFGDRAADPILYIDRSWADEPFSRGCYVGIMPPGTIHGFIDALRRPCGRIHWAGTETATQWNGYMEGAVQSGQRAAAEVLEA